MYGYSVSAVLLLIVDQVIPMLLTRPEHSRPRPRPRPNTDKVKTVPQCTSWR